MTNLRLDPCTVAGLCAAGSDWQMRVNDAIAGVAEDAFSGLNLRDLVEIRLLFFQTRRTHFFVSFVCLTLSVIDAAKITLTLPPKNVLLS